MTAILLNPIFRIGCVSYTNVFDADDGLIVGWSSWL